MVANFTHLVLPAVASTSDEAVSWTPTLIVGVLTVAALFRRLTYLSTATFLGKLPNINYPLTY
jgi:hypothetical protein